MINTKAITKAIIFGFLAFTIGGEALAQQGWAPVQTIKTGAPDSFWASIGKTAADYPNLTWWNFAANLVPVTIGNIIGGAVLVGAVYWFIYLRQRAA